MSKAFEEAAESEVSAIWQQKILARIRAVDEGRTEGVSFEDVMRDAEGRPSHCTLFKRAGSSRFTLKA